VRAAWEARGSATAILGFFCLLQIKQLPRQQDGAVGGRKKKKEKNKKTKNKTENLLNFMEVTCSQGIKRQNN